MRNPIYTFTDRSSTGINEIPDGALVVVENNGGTPEQFIRISGGSYDPTSTIQDLIGDGFAKSLTNIEGADTTTQIIVTSPGIEANEFTTVNYIIDNYNAAFVYSVKVSGGTATISGDTVSWTLPGVGTAYGIQISAKEGSLIASYFDDNINVIASLTEVGANVTYVGAELDSFSNNFQVQVQDNLGIQELTALGSRSLNINNNTIFYKDLAVDDTVTVNDSSKVITEVSDRPIIDSPLTDLSIINEQDFKAGPININTLAFNTDGSKLFISDTILNTIYEYNLGIPYDVNSKGEIINELFGDAYYGFNFSPDGLKLTVTLGSYYVYAYILTSPFDLTPSNLSVRELITINDLLKNCGEIIKGNSLVFNNDGTILYTAENDIIRQYNLSTAYDINTGVFINFKEIVDVTIKELQFNILNSELTFLDSTSAMIKTFEFSGGTDINDLIFKNELDITQLTGESFPSGWSFNSDGTLLFILGTSLDLITRIQLSTAYDVSTGVFEDIDSNKYNIFTQSSYMQNIFFNSNGTKMYCIYSGTIYQYSLITPWDLTDTNVTYDKSKYIVNFYNTLKIVNNNAYTNYLGILYRFPWLSDDIDDLTTYDYFIRYSGDLTLIKNLKYHDNGLGVFISTEDFVYNFKLSIAYDLKTAIKTVGSIYLTSITGEGLNIDPTASRIYISTGITTNLYELSIPGDITSVSTGISIDIDTNSTTFNSDGTKSINYNNNFIYTNNLANNYELSINDTLFSKIITQGSDCNCVIFGKNGTKIYRFLKLPVNTKVIIENYSLSEAYNITTKKFEGTTEIDYDLSDINSAFFRKNGEKLYLHSIMGLSEFTLSTPYDINTATFINSGLLATQTHTAFISKNGEKAYTNSYDDIFEYTLTTPYDLSSNIYIQSRLSFLGTYLEGLFFNDEGTKLYYRYLGIMYQYSLGTAWDISTIVDPGIPDFSVELIGSYSLDFVAPNIILNNLTDNSSQTISHYFEDTILKNIVTTNPTLPLEIFTAEKTTKLARSTQIEQNIALGDFIGVNNTIAKYKFNNYSVSSTADSLVSDVLIEVGDVLTIYNTTLSSGVTFTVTSVTYDDIAFTWTVDTTSVTGGTIPNVVFKNNTKLYIEIDGQKSELLNRVNVITSDISTITPEVEMDSTYDDLTNLSIAGRNFNYYIQFFQDYDKMIELTGSIVQLQN